MMKKILLLVSGIFLFSFGRGQDISFKINDLFERIGLTTDESLRLSLNDSIRTLVGSYASSDSVFDASLQNIQKIGQLSSPARDLKIINWNLLLPGNTVVYYCYIIKKGEKNENNTVYRLTGSNEDEPLKTGITYTGETWYGALYYDLEPLKFKNELYYILLGIDIGRDFINRKFIEVLRIDPAGHLVFGHKWFDSGKTVQYRVILEYDATGTMSLRFHSPKKIIFDHLVPLYKGDSQKLTFGAEFTLDSYTFKNGIWKFERNVDIRNKE